MTSAGRPQGARTPFVHGLRGFTLVEALVALAVLAGGLLALAAMQSGLARHADLSRQRSEAVRLAQERMENIRSFAQIPAVSPLLSWDHFGWDQLSSGSDSMAGNTDYRRNWALGGTSADPLRVVSVRVEWVDRTGQNHRVSLHSVVSKSDPAFSGSVGFPLPNNSPIEQPDQRHPNIPMAAIPVADGRSAYPLDAHHALIFDNATGEVVKQCETTVTTATDLGLCSNFVGHALSGYVSRRGDATWPNGVHLGDLTGLVFSGTQNKCKFAPATDPTSGVTLGNFYFYLCLLPVQRMGDRWGGTVRLSGVASGHTVCRYQHDRTHSSDPNLRNLQPYSDVKQSLTNQNYLVFKASGQNAAADCPDARDTGGFQTTLHQDCRSSNHRRADDCPALPFPG